jgi:hypothetical protein
MNLNPLYQWIETICAHYPHLKKWQAVGLALFSYGMVQARQCQAGQVAEALGEIGKADPVERRWQRWLANRRIGVTVSGQWWVRRVSRQFEGERLNLLVDETKLGDRIGVMLVSVAFERRAIPLMWRCYIAHSAADYPAEGQVKLIVGLLASMLPWLPAGVPVVVQADRGIGQSSRLMRELNALGVAYLLRVKPGSMFTSRRGRSHALRQLVQPGERHTLHGWLFTGRCRTKATLHLLWERGCAEPWCLVTNAPTLTGVEYACRVWQEESFRDLKSGGWPWPGSQVRDPEHAARLFLALAVAYAWTLPQGCFVLHADRQTQRQVMRGLTARKYSVLRLGLRHLKRMLKTHPAKVDLGLFFCPTPTLALKSVV